MLARADVPLYLLERGLLEAASIVSGDLVVEEISRRNRNYRVVRKRGPSYFVKQGFGIEGRSTVGREANVYKYLQSIDEARPLTRFLPRFIHYDPDPGVLVLELERDAENMAEYHARTGRVTSSVASSLGAAIGILHHATSHAQGSPQQFETAPPWIFRIHHPGLAYIQQASAANIALVQAIQRFPEFCDHLDGLHGNWRARCLIHGDLKSANHLVSKSRSHALARGLKVVDWELASMGDPAWDVGSVFGDYLALWLFSAPITGETPPERFLELTRFPLDRVSPAVTSFWESYRRHAFAEPAGEAEFMVRSVRYAAARLIQTTYEVNQRSARLDGNSVCILQVSWNLLRRPEVALASLLGLTTGISVTS